MHACKRVFMHVCVYKSKTILRHRFYEVQVLRFINLTWDVIRAGHRGNGEDLDKPTIEPQMRTNYIHLLLFYVILCYFMLFYVILCYFMLGYVILCYFMLFYVILCYFLLFFVIFCYFMLSLAQINPHIPGAVLCWSVRARPTKQSWRWLTDSVLFN